MFSGTKLRQTALVVVARRSAHSAVSLLYYMVYNLMSLDAGTHSRSNSSSSSSQIPASQPAPSDRPSERCDCLVHPICRKGRATCRDGTENSTAPAAVQRSPELERVYVVGVGVGVCVCGGGRHMSAKQNAKTSVYVESTSTKPYTSRDHKHSHIQNT